MDLPHSDDCFLMAFPAENTEAFLEGHHQARCGNLEAVFQPPKIQAAW
jgi:hypothetical protein